MNNTFRRSSSENALVDDVRDDNEDRLFLNNNGSKSMFVPTSVSSSSTTIMAEARTSAERAIQEAKRQSDEMIQRQQDRKRQHDLQKALRSTRKQQEQPSPTTAFTFSTMNTSTPRSSSYHHQSSSFLEASEFGSSNNFRTSSPIHNSAANIPLEASAASQIYSSLNSPELKIDYNNYNYAYNNITPGSNRRPHSSLFLEQVSEFSKPQSSPIMHTFAQTPSTIPLETTTNPLFSPATHKNLSSDMKMDYTKYYRVASLISEQDKHDKVLFKTADASSPNVEYNNNKTGDSSTAFNLEATIQELRLKQERDEVVKLKDQLATLEKSAQEKLDSDNEAYQARLGQLLHEKEVLLRISNELIVKHDVEITDCKQYMAEKDSHIEKLRKELDNKASHATELEDRLSKLTSTYKESETDKTKAITENSKLKNELQHCNEVIKSLNFDFASVKDENEILRKQFIDTESQRDTLSRLLRDLEAKNNAAEGEVAKMNKILSEKCSEITSLEESVVKLKSRIQFSESQATVQNDEISRLTVELKSKSEVINSLNIELDKAKNLQSLLSETECQRDSLARVVCELEKKNNAFVSELDSTKSELAKSTDDLERLIRDLAEKQSYIALVTSKLKHVEDESNARLKEKFQSEEKHLASIADMNLKMKDLEKQNITCMQECMQLERKLKEAEEGLGAAKSVARGAQACLESTLQTKDNTIANLEKSLASHRDTALSLREEVVELKQTTERQNDEIAGKNKEISRMSRLVTSDAQEIDKLNREINTLINENDNLSRLNVKLKNRLESLGDRTSPTEDMKNELKKASNDRLCLKKEVNTLNQEKADLIEKLEIEKRNRNSLQIELNKIRDERLKAAEAMESDNRYIASMERELSKSKSNISKLCRELDNKDHEIDRLIRDSDDLRHRNSLLQDEITKKKRHQECQVLEEKKRSSLQAMDIQLSNIRRENMELKSKLESKDDTMKRNERHLQEIQAELHQCQELVIELQSKVASEEMTNSKLMSDVTQLSEQLGKLSKDYGIEKNGLIHQCSISATKLEEQEQYIKQLQSDKKHLDDEIQVLSDELTRLTSENSSENTDLDNQNKRSALTIVEEQKRYIKKLKDDFAQVKIQSESYQNRLLEQAEHIKHLEANIKQLEDLVQASNASLVKAEAQIETYKSRVPEQEQYIEWIEADKNRLGRDVQMLKTTLVRLESQTESYRSSLTEREKSIEWLQAENSQMKNKLQEVNKALVEAEVQVESFKSRFPEKDHFIAQLQGDNRRIKDELHKLHDSRFKSGMQAEALAGRISEQENYINWLQADKVDLEKKVQKLSKMLTRAENEIEAYRGEHLTANYFQAQYGLKSENDDVAWVKAQDTWDIRQAPKTFPNAKSQRGTASFDHASENAFNTTTSRTQTVGCSENDFEFQQRGSYKYRFPVQRQNIEIYRLGAIEVEEKASSASEALVKTELQIESCKAIVPFSRQKQEVQAEDELHDTNYYPLYSYRIPITDSLGDHDLLFTT